LTTLYLAGAKNSNTWLARKGELQHAFPIDVPMLPPSMLTIAADGECLSCDIFSLGETIGFGNLEFITNRFGGISLSAMAGSSSAAIIGSTHRGHHPHCRP
jgi:hypothetical protein